MHLQIYLTEIEMLLGIDHTPHSKFAQGSGVADKNKE